MNFQTIDSQVKSNLEAIGIIGMDNDGNFEFSDTVLDDDMEDIEKQGLKMIKPFKKKKVKAKTKKVETVEKKEEVKIPKKYAINFSKTETEEAELVWATLEDLGQDVEIKDIFSFVMTKGFSSEEKEEIRKIASGRVLEEKLGKYLKENKLKMDREELLLHFLNEKMQ
jgi:hypothetical protein